MEDEGFGHVFRCAGVLFPEKACKSRVIQFTLIVIYGTINTTTMLALELWTELKGQECFVNQSLYKEML